MKQDYSEMLQGCLEHPENRIWNAVWNMTEAVRAISKWALAQEGVNRIEAETNPQNEASQRVLTCAGYVTTGEWGEEGPKFVYQGE